MNGANFTLGLAWAMGWLFVAYMIFTDAGDAPPPQSQSVEELTTEIETPIDVSDDSDPEDTPPLDDADEGGDFEAAVMDNAALGVNSTALVIIKENEDLRLEAFRNASGWLQIGYGHSGDDIELGQKISKAEANALLSEDLFEVENAIKAAVSVPLNDNEFSALASFAYDIGVSAFWSSTILDKLNAGDRVGAANSFLYWNKMSSNGELIEDMALTERRKRERELFLTPE